MGVAVTDRFVIGENGDALLDFLANDQREEGDHPYFLTPLPYWLSLNPQGYLIGNPDYDILARGERTTITLQYGLTGTGDTGTVPINITIVGRNDAPSISRPEVTYVGAHAPAGSLVTSIHAFDADRGARIAYSLGDDDGGRFAIDGATGQIRVVDGGDLDPARVRTERVVVIATDEYGAQDQLRLAIRVVPSVLVGTDHVATHGRAPAALYGGDGEDRLTDRHGSALLAGGGGNDSYVLARDGDDRSYGQVLEAPGGGIDVVSFTGTAYTLPDNVERLLFHGTGEQRDRVAVGNMLDNTIVADDGGGSLYGLGGDDRLTGGFAGGGLYGGDGNDTLIAGNSRSLLSGGIGDDVLFGENTGEYGGAGSDRFVFRYGTGTTEIYDFSVADSDRIDLRAIDADRATPADDRFRFIGTAPFTGEAGEIRYGFDDVGEATTVEGDTDGDKVADFSITLPAIPTLHSTDFVL